MLVGRMTLSRVGRHLGLNQGQWGLNPWTLGRWTGLGHLGGVPRDDIPSPLTPALPLGRILLLVITVPVFLEGLALGSVRVVFGQGVDLWPKPHVI